MQPQSRKTRRMFFIPPALVAGVLCCLPAGAQPIITADPEAEMIATNKTQGSTLIEWDAGSKYPGAEVWMEVEGDEEILFSSERKGVKAAVVALGKMHTFRLYKDITGTVVLDAVIVTGSRVAAGQNPPPSNPPSTPPPTAQPGGGAGGSKAPPTLGKRRKKPGVAGQTFQPGNAGAQTSKISAAFIRDVKVTPTAKNVRIAFKTFPNPVWAPLLEMAREAPNKVGGRYGFNSKAWQSKWEIRNEHSDPKKGEFVFDYEASRRTTQRLSGSPSFGLEPGSIYYYIITLPGSDGAAPTQETGSFTIPLTRVKVKFQNVNVINDSDPGGNGELRFNFFLNPGQESESYTYTKGPNLDTYLDWGEGNHGLIEVLEMNAGTPFLTIQVDGEDNDTVWEKIATDKPRTGPGDSGGSEWNVATASFDLRDHPGTFVTVPFKIRSMPHQNNTGDLEFEVSGVLEITRPKAQFQGTTSATTVAPPTLGKRRRR